MGVPLAHVGEDDLIAGDEAVDDLDRADGTAAEFDGDADGFLAIVDDFEEARGASFLALHGFRDMEDVDEAFEFDAAFDAEVGARTLRERAFEFDFDFDGAVLDGGIDALDAARDDSVSGIDARDLAMHDVTGLGFGDADIRAELGGDDDFGEGGGRGDSLADLKRFAIAGLLEHASDPGADGEIGNLSLFEGEHGGEFLNLGLLDRELGVGAVAGEIPSAFLDFDARFQVVRLGSGFFAKDFGHEAVAGEGVIRLGLEVSLGVFGAEGGELGDLIESIAFEGSPETFELGFRGAVGPFGVESGLFQLGVAEFEKDGIRGHLGAGLDEDSFNPAIGFGLDVLDQFGDEKSWAMDLPEHFAALDSAGPDGGPVDGGGGGFESKDDERDRGKGDRGTQNGPDTSSASGGDPVGAGDVHRVTGRVPKGVSLEQGSHLGISRWEHGGTQLRGAMG